MDEIHHYLKPYKDGFYKMPHFSDDESLGNSVSFFDGNKDWFLNVKTGIVIIGVPESGRADINSNCNSSPSKIRQHLYSLKNISSSSIFDAGDIQGNTVNDRCQALYDVVNYFYNKKLVILLIGGSQDLTVPLIEVLLNNEQSANLAVVDSIVDFKLNKEISSFSWLNFLSNINSQYEINVDFLGLQSYIQSQEGMGFLNNSSSDVMWLGQLLGEKFNNAEAILRRADIVSFDFRVIKDKPQWSDDFLSPNGLSANLACALSKFAGVSDVLKICGFFETPHNDSDCLLSAEMIWYFIIGVNNRHYDYPFTSAVEYKLYYVPIDGLDESIKFYQNTINNRWWIGVEQNDKEKLIPCIYDDYLQSLSGVIPNVWIRFNK